MRSHPTYSYHKVKNTKTIISFVTRVTKTMNTLLMISTIKQTRRILFKAYVILFACCSFQTAICRKATIIVVKQGKSVYSIIVPEKAPQSVVTAALELQRDVKEATGALLPLITTPTSYTGAFISLGATPEAKVIGINIKEIALEGFQILTHDGNIYIAGSDTPDGEYTSTGGKSNGTANGTYTFLEDYLFVKWLMPGDLGRDVPKQTTFAVNKINRLEVPAFFARKMPFMQNGELAVTEWERRQKLGASVNVIQRPSWKRNVPPSMFATHPEWFPLIDDKRIVDLHNYKLETTNRELIRLFAENAISSLKAHPGQYTVSLSPTDFPKGWSESEESKALYDNKRWGYQMTTTLMLKFYHDVAQIVSNEYPQGRVAGYIYDVYKSPPTNLESKKYLPLPSNFFPSLANNGDYGYRLYQSDNRQEMDELISFWTKQSSQLTYYGIPNRQDKTSGIILPPAAGLLNYSFSILTKYPVKGVLMYGNTTWSEGSLGNYIIARMMWNPKLDAKELQKEWLLSAYGSKAGKTMNQFYNKLDGWYNEYYQTRPSGYLYNVSDKLLIAVFAKHYPEIEQAFLKAKKELHTEKQKARFQLLEDNLILLLETLCEKKMLSEGFKSPLRRNEAQIKQILQQGYADFQLFPNSIR
jgi:hypothetical protein